MPSPGPEISIIVPTFNEINNAGPLIQALDRVLRGIRWEVIFVDDDSPDGTAELVQRMGRKDHRIRCIHRIHRRGLSSACIEGMLSSTTPFLAVMDGDMQHDENLLPVMLGLLKTEEIDAAIGSRYAEGGGIGDWDRHRSRMSRLATRLSRLIVKGPISDPMSGFFMIRRTALVNCISGISCLGYKVLLDLLASSPIPLRCRELPYQFRRRRSGKSKLNCQAAWGFGMLLLEKLMKRRIWGALRPSAPWLINDTLSWFRQPFDRHRRTAAARRSCRPQQQKGRHGGS